MFPSQEDWARVDAIEAKLAELDPIMQSFCERRGFRFSKMVDENRTLWPRRGMWVGEDIDRCMYLTMDLTVAKVVDRGFYPEMPYAARAQYENAFMEVLERGFYPEMPWSLHADATLPVAKVHPPRILRTDVFCGMPYSRLAEVLGKGLEDGHSILRSLTHEDVITKGEVFGGPPETFRGDSA